MDETMQPEPTMQPGPTMQPEPTMLRVDGASVTAEELAALLAVVRSRPPGPPVGQGTAGHRLREPARWRRFERDSAHADPRGWSHIPRDPRGEPTDR